MLAGDLGIVASCWVLSYVVRFHVLDSWFSRTDIPPLAPYLLMLVPILIVVFLLQRHIVRGLTLGAVKG